VAFSLPKTKAAIPKQLWNSGPTILFILREDFIFPNPFKNNYISISIFIIILSHPALPVKKGKAGLSKEWGV
jgi:hypothetical protein